MEFEYKGKFWLPEKPKNVIQGILRYNSNEGGELELYGSFLENNIPIPINLDKEKQIILGITDNGMVTLYKCFNNNSSFNLNVGTQATYYIETIFIGCHFKNTEEIKFKQLTVSYTNLDDWIGITGLNREISLDNDNNFQRLNISYEYPEDFEFNFDKFTIKIAFGFQNSFERFKADLSQNTTMKIIPENSLHLKNYQEKPLFLIPRFLSLAVGKPVYPIYMIGINDKFKVKVNDEEKFIDISIYSGSRNYEEPQKNLNIHDMFFTFGDVREDLEECLKNWFTKYDKLGPIYNLYFSSLYNPYNYLETDFLNLAQAIETYHRRMFKGKYLESSEYREISSSLKDEIPDNVTDEHRESLKSKIDFGNEFSLKTRLIKIFDKYQDALELLIPEKDIFIKDVRNTRNYYTHYSKDLEKKAKKGQELVLLKERLKFTIEVCLLYELGIDQGNIINWISRDGNYWYLKNELNSL